MKSNLVYYQTTKIVGDKKRKTIITTITITIAIITHTDLVAGGVNRAFSDSVHVCARVSVCVCLSTF